MVIVFGGGRTDIESLRLGNQGIILINGNWISTLTMNVDLLPIAVKMDLDQR